MNKISMAIVFALMLIGATSGVFAEPSALSDQAMAAIIGGYACRDCGDNSERLDECHHYANDEEPVPCNENKCIANYHLSDSCGLDTPPGCDTTLSPDMPAVVQYIRQDSECAWSTTSWHIWIVDWYTFVSGCCIGKPWEASCDKTNGECDGELIRIDERGEQILCVE